MYHQIGSASHRLWSPRKENVNYRNIGWIVNTCADADEFEHGLMDFATLLENVKLPVINHPIHVQASRLDKLHQALAGADGLEVPKSVRFQTEDPEAFRRVFQDEELAYPVAVHMPATNDPAQHVLIESDVDWDRIFALPWGGQSVYITQSLKEAPQVKASFLVTPFGARLGHVSVQSGVDAAPMEKRLSQSHRIQQIAKDIRSRVPLDIFGIEIGLHGDDEFVLLNLSAAMTFEMPDCDTASERVRIKKRFREIERDIWKTLKYVTKVPFKVQLSQ